MSTKGIIGGIIIAAVIVLTLVWGYSHYKKTKQKAKAERVAAEKYAAAHPPAPVTSTGGRYKTLYVFLPDGCVTKYLQGNWERYPKGGKIKFLNSQGKVVLIDEPGTYVPSSLPADNYKICKADPKAWGVEIWE